MNIQNPSINDICFGDLVSIKNTVTNVKGHNEDKVYDIYNCTEKIKIYTQLEDAKYQVRYIDYTNSKVVIFGITKNFHPRSYYNECIKTEMEISVEDIDTVYSKKRGDDFLDIVYKNMIELTYLLEDKFKEIFKDKKYWEITCGCYDTEFSPCVLIDYVMNGHNWSVIDGFYNLIRKYFIGEFFEQGKFYHSINNYENIWNERALQDTHWDYDYNDLSLNEYIKFQLQNLANSIHKDYKYILNEIQTNSIRLKQRDCCCDNTKATNEEITFLCNALTHYYEWMMSLITPLINSNVNEVHNTEINRLIKKC